MTDALFWIAVGFVICGYLWYRSDIGNGKWPKP